MIAKQKQLLETFVRVQAFTVAHPVTGPLSYGTCLLYTSDAADE